jgi:hypothetical protein
VAGEVVFTLTEDTLVSGVQFQQRGEALFALGTALMGASLMTVAFLMDWNLGSLLWVLMGSIALGAYVLVTFAKLPGQLRKQFRQNPDACQPVELRWSEADLEISSGGTQTRKPWVKIWRWRENDDVLLIYFAYQTSHIVPKRALAEAGLLNDLRSHLQRLVLQPRPLSHVAIWGGGFLLSFMAATLGFGYLLIVTDWLRFDSIWGVLVTFGIIGAGVTTASLLARAMALLSNRAEQYEKEMAFFDEFPTYAPWLQRLSRRYTAWLMRPARYDSRNRVRTRK